MTLELSGDEAMQNVQASDPALTPLLTTEKRGQGAGVRAIIIIAAGRQAIPGR
jgi:hypothetical protein